MESRYSGKIEFNNAKDLVTQEKSGFLPKPRIINLFEYPSGTSELPTQYDTLTIGDLHGNAIKLINFLQKENVIKFTREEYQFLTRLYQSICELYDEAENYTKLSVEYNQIFKSYNDTMQDLQNLQTEKKELVDNRVELIRKKELLEKKLAPKNKKQKTENLSTTLDININISQELYMLDEELAELDVSLDLINMEINALNEVNSKLITALDNHKAHTTGLDVTNRLKKLKKYDLPRFEVLIDNLSILAKPHIRMLGDELGDRGACDFLTLYLVIKMITEKIPVTSILSNHLVAFLEIFYFQKESWAVASNFMRSMHTLIYLCSNGVLDADKLRAQIKEFYLPRLKLIDAEVIDGAIIIYNHAPSDLGLIASYAKYFNIPLKEKTPEELKQTIDQINHAFQKYIIEHNALPRYGYSRKQGELFDKDTDPIAYGIFNRDYEDLDRPERHPIYGYLMFWVNGHDSKEKGLEKHIIVLDDELGKSDFANTHDNEQIILVTNCKYKIAAAYLPPTLEFTKVEETLDQGAINPSPENAIKNKGTSSVTLGFMNKANTAEPANEEKEVLATKKNKFIDKG